jgi:hypothetical protein
MTTDPASSLNDGPRAIPRWLVVSAVVGIIALSASIVLVPGSPPGISGKFSTAIDCSNCTDGGGPVRSIPQASNVTLVWSDQSGGIVDFWVIGPLPKSVGPPFSFSPIFCLSSNATAGSCSFGSAGAAYDLGARTPVGVSEGPQVVSYTVTYNPWSP